MLLFKSVLVTTFVTGTKHVTRSQDGCCNESDTASPSVLSLKIRGKQCSYQRKAAKTILAFIVPQTSYPVQGPAACMKRAREIKLANQNTADKKFTANTKYWLKNLPAGLSLRV